MFLKEKEKKQKQWSTFKKEVTFEMSEWNTIWTYYWEMYEFQRLKNDFHHHSVRHLERYKSQAGLWIFFDDFKCQIMLLVLNDDKNNNKTLPEHFDAPGTMSYAFI